MERMKKNYINIFLMPVKEGNNTNTCHNKLSTMKNLTLIFCGGNTKDTNVFYSHNRKNIYTIGKTPKKRGSRGYTVYFCKKKTWRCSRIWLGHRCTRTVSKCSHLFIVRANWCPSPPTRPSLLLYTNHHHCLFLYICVDIAAWLLWVFPFLICSDSRRDRKRLVNRDPDPSPGNIHSVV